MTNRFGFSGESSLGLEGFSLGNIGYSGIYCASSSTVMNKMTLKCYGGGKLDSVEGSGVNPPGANWNLCWKTSDNEACQGNFGGASAMFAA